MLRPGIVAVVLLLFVAVPGKVGAVDVPPEYQLDTPMSGLNRPSVIAFSAATEQVFVAERGGTVQVFDGVDDPQPTLSLDISDQVHAYIDRGMMGMALDPDYPAKPYLYLSYTRDAPLGEEAPVHEQDAQKNDNCVRITGETPVEEKDGECVVSGRVARVELDPATGIAKNGAETPAEQPLVTSWCQQYGSHSMGALQFDAEGALLVNGGEAASYAALDYGQFGNPCGDPELEGGALRSQDLRGRWNDPVDYSGTVIRIDPATGDPWPTNRPYDTTGRDEARIIAYGLRNPFRMAIRPGTDELYIGDVGSSYFDELNMIPDPVNQGPEGSNWPSNFGWPCFEADEPHVGFQALAYEVPLPICQDLYENSSYSLRTPYLVYPRAGKAFPGDQCDPSSGAALSGLAFYEGSESLGALPEDLEGSLLMVDAARGCVWTVDEGEGGRPDPTDIDNLVTRTAADEGGFVPVNLTVGPDGALYMPNFWRGQIVRLRHFAGNQPPAARLAPAEGFEVYGLMNGEGRFPVELDASGSNDAEGEEVSYEWDLDGDGTFELGPSAEPTVEHEYTAPENVVAQVRVTDEEGADNVARITLYPGDLPPQEVTLLKPVEGPEWTVGDKIEAEGSATDPAADADDGEPPQLRWNVELRHCPDDCHSHPHADFAGPAGSFTAPDHEYPSYLRVNLTAVDSRGLSVTVTRSIHPKPVDVTLASVPSGVPLTIASTKRPTPFTERLLSGGDATVAAPETTTIGGVTYKFARWSDGGKRTHLIKRTENDTLVAHFTPLPLPVPTPPSNAVTPTLPKEPTRVGARFLTRPRGLPLRLQGSWRRSPFRRQLAKGGKFKLEAPKRIKRRGWVFTFSHWKSGSPRVRWIKPRRSKAYVAVFKRRLDDEEGFAQALTWRRAAP